jgi:hypothetical protein
MALLLLFLLLLVAPQQTSATAPFDTHQLVEAKLNASMVDRIIRGFPDVELWQVAPAEPPSALARNATVQPPLNAQFFAAAPDLAELSARFPRELSSRKILSGQGQLGAWWESERLRMEARIAARPLTNASAPEAFEEFFEDYRPYDEIEAYMDLILLEYPEIATPFTLELPTREGRTMRGIRFGVGEEVKPAFYLQGSAHANEWLGTMAAMWAVVQLAEGYRAGDEQIVRLVEGLTIWCVPVLNVDGYLHTWTPGGRNWRKNRRDNGDGSFVRVVVPPSPPPPPVCVCVCVCLSVHEALGGAGWADWVIMRRAWTSTAITALHQPGAARARPPIPRRTRTAGRRYSASPKTAR